MTPCSPLSVNRRFGGTYRLHLQGRISSARNQHASILLATCLLAVCCSAYFFDPEDGGDVPPKRRFTLNGLYGVISQKMILFITTAVKTSNPAYWINSIVYFSHKSLINIYSYPVSMFVLEHLLNASSIYFTNNVNGNRLSCPLVG
jgi:hypothetical protein